MCDQRTLQWNFGNGIHVLNLGFSICTRTACLREQHGCKFMGSVRGWVSTDAMHGDLALGLWRQILKFPVHILALPLASCVTLQAFPHL